MRNGKLVIKPNQDAIILNNKLTKIAILNQIILEEFDEVADFKEVWNKTLKRDANNLKSQLEKLQISLYEKHFKENESSLIYASQCFERLLELLNKTSVDEYIDLMGFLEVKRADQRNGTKYCETFLLEQTERINKQLEEVA